MEEFCWVDQNFGRVDPHFWLGEPKNDEGWGNQIFVQPYQIFGWGYQIFGQHCTQKNLTPLSIKFFLYESIKRKMIDWLNDWLMQKKKKEFNFYEWRMSTIRQLYTV